MPRTRGAGACHIAASRRTSSCPKLACKKVRMLIFFVQVRTASRGMHARAKSLGVSDPVGPAGPPHSPRPAHLGNRERPLRPREYVYLGGGVRILQLFLGAATRDDARSWRRQSNARLGPGWTRRHARNCDTTVRFGAGRAHLWLAFSPQLCDDGMLPSSFILMPSVRRGQRAASAAAGRVHHAQRSTLPNW